MQNLQLRCSQEKEDIFGSFLIRVFQKWIPEKQTNGIKEKKSFDSEVLSIWVPTQKWVAKPF